MEKISRRKFLKRSAALGDGAVLTVYANGSYTLALAGPASQAEAVYKLRVIHTNDHHARVEPVFNNNQPVHGGVSRRKKLIDDIRASAKENLLLIDAADVFQGTAWFNLYSGAADLEFYNAMGYEAMGIGNHEFDKGPVTLANFIKGAKFPVISANVAVAAGDPLSGLIKPWVILERGGEKIGLFGLTPPDTGTSSSGGAGITFTDPLAAARKSVSELQAQGAARIIGLTHVGIDVDREIARTVPGISLIVGGHTHTPMGPQVSPPDSNRPYPEVIVAPDGRPTIVVTDWEWGRWLGDLTLSFDTSGRVVFVQGQPVEVTPSLPADGGFEARINELNAPIAAARVRQVGVTNVLLDGVRENVRTKETNLGNLTADALLAKGQREGAQIALQNGGGIRASIPVGNITSGQVRDVQPFDNTLMRVDITGAQLKEALENGVSQVEQVGGRFPQVAGMRFTWNPAAPVGSRVVDIQIQTANGFVAYDPGATYRLATINFLVSGGDGYSVLGRGTNKYDTGFIQSDLLEEYIAAKSPITAGVEGRISQGTAAAQPAQPGTPAQPVPAQPGTPPPASLPNTGGAADSLWWLASLGAGALGSGLALRRRAQEPQPAEPVDKA